MRTCQTVQKSVQIIMKMPLKKLCFLTLQNMALISQKLLNLLILYIIPTKSLNNYSLRSHFVKVKKVLKRYINDIKLTSAVIQRCNLNTELEINAPIIK